jgi:putative redox protein
MLQPDLNVVEVVLQDGMRFEARDSRGATAILDAAPPGGEGAGMTPMEFLLAGLGGCTAMDVISILRKKRQEVTDYRVEIAGARGLDHPKPYTDITIRHTVTGQNISTEAVRHAIELSEEKYCPVHAMLSKAATISTTFEVRSEKPFAIAQRPVISCDDVLAPSR